MKRTLNETTHIRAKWIFNAVGNKLGSILEVPPLMEKTWIKDLHLLLIKQISFLERKKNKKENQAMSMKFEFKLKPC